MKKFFCILLSFLMLMISLAACTPSVPPPEKPPNSDPTPEPTVPDLDLIANGELRYSLLRPNKASDMIVDAYEQLEAALSDTFGVTVTAITDKGEGDFTYGDYLTDEPEILLGQTNRYESREVWRTLEQGQYAIRIMDDKLVIIGYTDALTVLAAEAFVTNYIQMSNGQTLSVKENLSIIAEPYAKTDNPPSLVFDTVTPVGALLSANTEQWVACEIEMISDKEYEDPVYTQEVDVIFHHEPSGKTMQIPAFWDGGTSWKVRFAPTEIGEWSFYTTCTDPTNKGLHHRAGTVNCRAYEGELAIYQHGFVKTVPGKSYFMYADGTPFFYLGDTYWSMPLLELDSYGSVETQKNAGITQSEAEANHITSQFTYILDYRAKQGYTVIQSQPLGWWTNPGQNGWFADEKQNIFTYGVNELMLAKFQQYDRYFSYIAEKGLVHSNTQFGYPTALMTEYFDEKITDEQLEKLCRYWVARYGAYPVMWATTQEGDNDYYGDRGDSSATPETNPWLKVFAYVQKHDAYDHPSTCHQENWGETRVENSAFGPLDGHTWYAAQYSTPGKSTPDWDRLREYWNNPGSKPVINYEGRYDHFWTGTYGARAQGWIAYMNGHFGYGYGVQPIWNIFWSGNGITNWTGNDEWGNFNMDDNWLEGLYSDAGEQVTYIRDVLSQYEWWRLTPCFDQSYFYKKGQYLSCVSHIDSSLYLAYCYGTRSSAENFGTLTAMENSDYEVRWFNCQTGEYEKAFTITITDGTYKIPARPDDGDWLLSVELIG